MTGTRYCALAGAPGVTHNNFEARAETEGQPPRPALGGHSAGRPGEGLTRLCRPW